ncbi:MAG: bifunctional nuclease family protein [Desulfohalobiaceae bacterium]
MLEMQVFGLALDEESQVPLLILKDASEEYVLPIWIGAMEAMSISMTLNKVKLPRPMTHDLMLQSLDTVGVTVDKVAVVELREGTYYAEIFVSRGEESFTIDSRPSDAIALALRAEAPIFVSESVLEQVAEHKEQKVQPVIDSEDAEKWNELLENLDVDDSKYKM